ncbi:hypothetical protein K3495_g2295 [Podosphaera aphanis]|nr:hypothetical protein K3495_g2295 [Podosphaera aphanis]
MSAANSNGLVNTENGLNKTTWGTIEIFNVWAIVCGEAKKPEKSGKEGSWNAKRERATVIIAGSVSSLFRGESFRKATDARDAVALWKEVSSLNQNANGILTTANRARFYNLPFNPEKTKINEYFSELMSLRSMLHVRPEREIHAGYIRCGSPHTGLL